MPLADLTLDTNVLLHSYNAIEARHAHSVDLLHRLALCATTKLAIDAGFSMDPARNASLIGAEYISKIVPGTLPFYVLTQLFQTERIVSVKSVLPAQSSRKLNQLVANKRDRTFIKVCANSIGRILVSHDFDDFPSAKRREIGKLFDISIIDASTCAPKV